MYISQFLRRPQRRAVFFYAGSIVKPSGYVKLHRSLLDNSLFFKDKNATYVFITLLLLVDRETGTYRGGRFKLASITGIKPRTIYDVCKRLATHTMITCNPHADYTEITVVNWKKYQDAHTPDERQTNATHTQLNTIQEVRSKNKEVPIRKEEFKTYFKEKKTAGNISPAMRGQVAKVIKLFEDARAGVYNNRLHTEPIAGLIKKHGYDMVYEKTEEALSLPKTDYNPWFDKPIDLADHFDWLVNRPLIGEAGERQKLIDDMRKGGFNDRTINATLKQHNYEGIL